LGSQLIFECKEVLLGGVNCKQYYQHMARCATNQISDIDGGEEMGLEQFEENMQEMLEVGWFDMCIM